MVTADDIRDLVALTGAPVLPLRPGEKTPAITGWPTEATVDDDTITQWWSTDDVGVGVVCGPRSGIWVLDVDRHETDGEITLAALCEIHGELPATWEVATPRGRHLWFTWDTEIPVRNDSGRLLGPGVDVRGEGGYVVAPPTELPAGAYRWTVSPLDVPLAAPPRWLLERLTVVEKPARVQPVANGDRPGDRFNTGTCWPDLLEADGAQWLGTHRGPDGTTYDTWARPGVDHTSATVGYGGSDMLHVFTTAWPHLDPGTYDRFGYWARTRCGGDIAQAARQAARIFPQGGDRSPGTPPTVVTGHHRPDVDDDDPIPVGPPDIPAEPFPLDTLPPWIVDHCLDVARRVQIPVDVPAWCAIAAVAGTLANRTELEITRGRRESTNLFVAFVQRSGAGKTAVTNMMFAPLRQLETDLQQTAFKQVVEAQARVRALQKRENKLVEQFASNGDTKTLDEIRRCREQIVDTEKLAVTPRLFAQNATTEALVTILAEQHRLIVSSDEAGGIFGLLAGRYTGKIAADLDPWLQGWSRSTIQQDRVGRGAVKVDMPALTVCLGVQPAVLAKIPAANPAFQGAGLLARFLWVAPPDIMGTRDYLTDRDADNSGDLYHTRLHRLGVDCQSWLTPAVVKLDKQAARILAEHTHAREPDLAETGGLAAHTDWASKLEIQTARLALILAWVWAEPGVINTVTATDMTRATRLADTLVSHAVRVWALWDNVAPTAVQTLLKWARRQDGSFTLRDVRRGTTLRSHDDALTAVTHLVDAGWLTPIDTEGRAQRWQTKPIP